MTKSEIDRIQELLLINAALRGEVKELKEMLVELLDETVETRERLDNIVYGD